MHSIMDKVWWGLRGVLVLLNNLYCIPTYVIWCMLLHPILYLSPQLYWAIEGQFFYWLLTMVAYWSHSANYRIIESGDEIDKIKEEETLVLVNHQSTSDVPLLMAAFSTRPGLLQNLNWIMDAVFKYTNFGIVSFIHGDFFINAGRDRREASIQELVAFLKGFYMPRKRKWLILFPEGGFLRKRRETSNRYSRKQGLPELEHVTLPRMGAMQAIVETVVPAVNNQSIPNHNHVKEEGGVSEGLKYVVDMTIAYPKGEPLDLVAIVTGCVPPCHVHFHYRVFPIHEVPVDRGELQNWLYTRYLEKEKMLGKYYESGIWDGVVPSLVESTSSLSKSSPIHIPPSTDKIKEESPPLPQSPPPRIIHQDLVRVLIIHFFFILSSLCHFIMFRRLGALLPTTLF